MASFYIFSGGVQKEQNNCVGRTNTFGGDCDPDPQIFPY